MLTSLYNIPFCQYPWTFSLRWHARNIDLNWKVEPLVLAQDCSFWTAAELEFVICKSLIEICWNVRLFKVEIIILFSAMRYMRLGEQLANWSFVYKPPRANWIKNSRTSQYWLGNIFLICIIPNNQKLPIPLSCMHEVLLLK